MAIIFTWPITNMFLHQCFYTQWLTGALEITLYSGSQPSAADVTANYFTYASQSLVHWTGASWITPTTPDSTTEIAQFMTLNIPLAKTAFRSGTANWAILWGSSSAASVTEAQAQFGPLPLDIFVIVPVTASGGKGVVKMTTTTITSGSSYQPTDVTIRVGLV